MIDLEATAADEQAARHLAYGMRTKRAMAAAGRMRRLPAVRLALAMEWGCLARSAVVGALRKRERDLARPAKEETAVRVHTLRTIQEDGE